MGLFRKKLRLREIGESEAYGRMYGERSPDVHVVKLEPRRPRYELRVTGEKLRRAFLDRLDSRGSAEREGPSGVSYGARSGRPVVSEGPAAESAGPDVGAAESAPQAKP